MLHLIAIARSVDIDLTIDDFQAVSERVPFLADLKPDVVVMCKRICIRSAAHRP